VAVNPETHQQDLASMANKVLIALLSYIPISLIRSILVNRQIARQRREMYRELEDLKKRVAELERSEKAKEKPPAEPR
jgi:cell division protein FtsB